MRLSSPKRIFDLNEFLPPDGEDKFELHYVEGNLTLVLFYESEEGVKSNKTICFYSALQFIQSPFPGVSPFSCEESDDISFLHSVVEYGYSELLERVLDERISIDFKHHRVLLHSVGFVIFVIAQSVEVY